MQKYKAQNIVKFSFITFSADFFKFSPQNLLHFDILKMLSAQNNFYISLNSYVKGHVKKEKIKFEFHGWFPGLQNLDVFLENLLWSDF